MGSVDSARRRPLLAGLLGALLLGIVALAWLAFDSLEIVRGPAQTPEVGADLPPRIGDIGSLDRVPPPQLAEAAASPAAPTQTGRKEIERDATAQALFELLVRTRDEGTPIPGCEVIYFETGEAVHNELERLLSRSGFDLEALRRVARRSFADDNGLARLPAASGRLYVLALSATHFGSDFVDSDASAGETRTIDCQPMYFVRAQVVDAQGTPRAGIQICLAKKEHGFMDYPVVATTRGPEGLADIGPLELDELDVFILRIAGGFPEAEGLELNPGALPPQPIQLVLPAHGTLAVRLVESDGRPFRGTAEVELEFVADGIDFAGQAPEWVALGSGIASFSLIGLGLDLRAKVTIPGRERAYELSGPGPRWAGEQAVLEVKLDAGSVTLFGRALDIERRPLRFRELRAIGAVQLRPYGARQFEQRVHTDAVGNFALTLDACDVEGAAATLLLVLERETGSLGNVKPLVVRSGPNDLGPWTLAPAGLLASGRVVESTGEDAPEIAVELQNPVRPLGISWAEPARSTEQGKFELRGWSSESMISILSGTRGARLREPMLIAKGSAEVVLPRAGSSPDLRNP